MTNTISIPAAKKLIQNGGVIAYPTEAVYGLGCDPLQNDAVTRIRHLKERQDAQGFIVIASQWQQVANWVTDIPKPQLDEILQSWPGHVTWIFPASSHAPDSCIAADHTIAIRVSAHPLVIELCDALGHALVSTSANPHGLAPARSSHEVDEYFHDQIDGILDGQLAGQAKPSQIRDALSGRILR